MPKLFDVRCANTSYLADPCSALEGPLCTTLGILPVPGKSDYRYISTNAFEGLVVVVRFLTPKVRRPSSPGPGWLSSMRDAVDAIPDGIRLAEFPVHGVGAQCWCRPYVSFVPGAIIVRHKNLDRGEFDS